MIESLCGMWRWLKGDCPARFALLTWGMVAAILVLGTAVNAELEPNPKPGATARPEMVLEIADVASDLAFSPDGKALAAYSVGGRDGVELWDNSTHRLKRVLRGYDFYKLPAFTADGRTLIVSKGQNTFVSDVASGQTHRLAYVPPTYRDATNGKLIATFTAGVVRVFDLRSGKRLSSFREDADEMFFSPDGQRLAVANGDEVRVWDVPRGKRLCSTRRPARSAKAKGNGMEALTPVVFSPDGRLFATAGADPAWQVPEGDWGDSGYTVDYVAKIWDARTGKLLRVFKAWSSRTTPCVPLTFSPDGQNLVCGAAKAESYAYIGNGSGPFVIWNVHSGKKLLEAEYQCFPALSRDSSLLACFDKDGTGIRVYSLTSAKLVRTFAFDADQSPASLAISPDNRSIVMEGANGFSLSWWDWRRGVKTFSVAQGYRVATPTSIVFSADGTRVRSHYHRGNYGRIYEWDARSGRLAGVSLENVPAFNSRKRIPLFGKPNEYEVVSPDGKRALVASNNGGGQDEFLSAWDVATKTLLWKQKIEGETKVYEAFISPDGKTVATFHYLRKPSSLALRDMATGRLLYTLDASSYVDRISFSADSRSLTAEDPSSSRICVWDVKTGKRRGTLKEEIIYPVAVALSPDGTRLVRLGTEGDVTLYDVASSKVLLTWTALAFPEGREPQWVATTPEGYYTASKSAEPYIRWRVGSQIFPLQRYRSTFFRPDLVQQALQGKGF